MTNPPHDKCAGRLEKMRRGGRGGRFTVFAIEIAEKAVLVARALTAQSETPRLLALTLKGCLREVVECGAVVNLPETHWNVCGPLRSLDALWS